jgi:hypothetical protein
MGKIAPVLWLGVFGVSGLSGCDTIPQHDDALVAELVAQATAKTTPPPAPAPPNAPDARTEALRAIILREIPDQTPVAQARALMEAHGFSCWTRVPDDHGTCLHCTAYRRTGVARADKVVVKLYHEDGRVVEVVVRVERNVYQRYATPYAPIPDDKASGRASAAPERP